MTNRKDGILITATTPETDAAQPPVDAPVPATDEMLYAEIGARQGAEAALSDQATPTIGIEPAPFLTVRSGRYLFNSTTGFPPRAVPVRDRLPFEVTLPESLAGEQVYDEDVNAIIFYQREEIHLDVDGRYPQMQISGTRSGALTVAAHWIASVARTGANTFEGPIWYKDGAANTVPHTKVSATVSGGPVAASRKLTITFSGGGAAAFSRTYDFVSTYHRAVEFEFDRVADAVAVTSIATHAHPNRPATLPSETLSLETVYRRAGFDVTKSGGDTVIPINVAGQDALWTDQEMHDAMQTHWSRFANKPQWTMWTLFARMHIQGNSLGGIMFDDIGPNHRQGTAIFSGAFIATPPAGDPAPAAWVARMRFWTAAHEMGHAFNLAHSWQKAASPNLPGNPWIPLANEPLARSFMNYPYNVPGGQAAFFADFAYRFSDAELLFMRHAPTRFVQMGNSAWFTNHGFQEAARDSNPDYELRLSVTAPEGRFRYLAPPVVEAALINRSAGPRVVSGTRLASRASLALIINPEKGEPRQWLPHLRHCAENVEKVLQPGEALFDSIMIGTGRNGWDLAEPGRYCIQAVLDVDGQPVYSNQVMVTVAPPVSREEERLAADLFTPEVGQVLAVNGSRGMDQANNVLAAALELTDNPISKLAAVAIATPLSYTYKLIGEDEAAPIGAEALALTAEVAPQRSIDGYAPDPAAVRELLAGATDGRADELVNAMGHARFLRDAPVLAGVLVDEVPEGLASFDAVAERPEQSASMLPVSDALEAALQHKAGSLGE